MHSQVFKQLVKWEMCYVDASAWITLQGDKIDAKESDVADRYFVVAEFRRRSSVQLSTKEAVQLYYTFDQKLEK